MRYLFGALLIFTLTNAVRVLALNPDGLRAKLSLVSKLNLESVPGVIKEIKKNQRTAKQT